MSQKTTVHAEEGKQDLTITRVFNISLELLFKAYTDSEIIAQWMGTKVIKLENKNHGSFKFETSDKNGNVAFRANGTIHEFTPNQRIIRTFEMENAPFGVQIEFLKFEKISDDNSKLSIHTIYKSVVQRDQMLQLPFAQGINMAHNRLEQILQH